jgi:asparagine synthase (glutamine-hydrolysing)
MSSILGVFGGAPLPEDTIMDMLAQSLPMSVCRRPIWRGEGATLAVATPDWQALATDGVEEGIAQDEGLVVVADASLYYRADLLRALRGVGAIPRGGGPAHLILAAYRAWADACVDHLEGDWAFVLWDSRSRRALAARDYGGRRTLHFAQPAGALAIGSSLSGVLRHPRCSDDLNLVSIAETASSLMASSHETCYREVRRLNAGHSLRWERQRLSTGRHWTPQPREGTAGPGFEEAAEHLRHLLTRATAERLAPEGATSIQLSGGWDSTAIFGVGKELLRSRGTPGALLPVSISYPVGDPGREDEIIQMILDHWNASTRWVDIGGIPLWDGPERTAKVREEPFGHVYEHWNRRLAREGRSLGTHVMLDGFGGDSLFQCSPFYLATLLKRGRLREFRREWKSKRLTGLPDFFRWGVRPLLPRRVEDLFASGPLARRLKGEFQREVPAWIAPRFVRAHGLVERERENTPQYDGNTGVDSELYWHLSNPWVSRMLAENYAYGVQERVEIRSPLFDRRVIEFSMTRPWQERSYRRETKRLLRRSVRGLLPDDVLAPRRYRTGMTTGYFQREMREALPQLRERWLHSPVLADVGIVEPATLLREVDRFLESGDMNLGVNLFFTIQTEIWLRTRSDGVGGERGTAQTLVLTA